MLAPSRIKFHEL